MDMRRYLRDKINIMLFSNYDESLGGERVEADGRVNDFLKICFVWVVGQMVLTLTYTGMKEKDKVLKDINNNDKK